MKKRLTALLLALTLLSALAVGIAADEQTEETAAETAQTTPDAAGPLSSGNLGARMRAACYDIFNNYVQKLPFLLYTVSGEF